MISLGNWNEMTIIRFTDHGAYLDGGDAGEILMPRAYVRPEMRPGDTVTVFVYLDQQERAVATTETPLARVGDFACLRVNWTNRYGAFLDWGLMKDLFVPFAEQREPMQRGRSYIIYVRLDERTRRIVGTARVDRYLRPAPADYRRGARCACSCGSAPPWATRSSSTAPTPASSMPTVSMRTCTSGKSSWAPS